MSSQIKPELYHLAFADNRILLTEDKQYFHTENSIEKSGLALESGYSVKVNDALSLCIHQLNADIESEQIAGIRSLLPQIDSRDLELLIKAKQIYHWLQDHQYCGRCGNKNALIPNKNYYLCQSCKLEAYPRISPSMIVLISRGDELLLGRSPHFLPNMYSLLAGFVETGESLEQAVHREVLEEVGIKIKNLQYQYSQSWPFPHTLMLGFHAEYDSGEIQIDKHEIEDAAWFKIDALPILPNKHSIARQLIDGYLSKPLLP